VLYEPEVPAAEALSVARRLRADGRSVSPIRRRGKFGAQLGRLEEWGFGSLVHLRADGAGEERQLGGS
jgi:histidyl-tRNA synthetase